MRSTFTVAPVRIAPHFSPLHFSGLLLCPQQNGLTRFPAASSRRKRGGFVTKWDYSAFTPLRRYYNTIILFIGGGRAQNEWRRFAPWIMGEKWSPTPLFKRDWRVTRVLLILAVTSPQAAAFVFLSNDEKRHQSLA